MNYFAAPLSHQPPPDASWNLFSGTSSFNSDTLNQNNSSQTITAAALPTPPTPHGDATTSSFQQEEDGSVSRTNVFVCHLPCDVNDDALRSMFEPFGIIESSVVMRDIFSGASRGIAFVQFADEISAALAIEKMNNAVVNEKRISVQPAKKYARGTPTARVFVRNIPNSVTEAELAAAFQNAGVVVQASIHPDSMRSVTLRDPVAPVPQVMPALSRRIGFVTMNSVEEAAAASAMLHNTTPFLECDGVPLLTKVVVDNLPPKRERKAGGAGPNASLRTNNNQYGSISGGGANGMTKPYAPSPPQHSGVMHALSSGFPSHLLGMNNSVNNSNHAQHALPFHVGFPMNDPGSFFAAGGGGWIPSNPNSPAVLAPPSLNSSFHPMTALPGYFSSSSVAPAQQQGGGAYASAPTSAAPMYVVISGAPTVYDQQQFFVSQPPHANATTTSSSGVAHPIYFGAQQQPHSHTAAF